MSKKKNKNKQPQKPIIQISQCMIVKNEEKNIEKALTWGKGIVGEQIVVDTGSTDDTVIIAEKTGARVLHFDWINDFAAAKNFAIEQASGKWIAFLDADEYFPKEDAALLLPILKQIHQGADTQFKGKYAISCPMHQLNDKGETMTINMQVRLFRNTQRVRYVGRIHEQLNIGAPEIIRTNDIKIMHTGYSTSAYLETDKIIRNISMIRKELEEDPNDLRMKMYLADSLVSYSVVTGDKACRDEADELYIEVASAGEELDADYRKTAMKYLMDMYTKTGEHNLILEEISEKAYKDFPDDNTIVHLYSAVLDKMRKK